MSEAHLAAQPRHQAFLFAQAAVQTAWSTDATHITNELKGINTLGEQCSKKAVALIQEAESTLAAFQGAPARVETNAATHQLLSASNRTP
ncbi:hypothetical protein PZF67_005237 [Pseudomonas aeruginosa]|uniref:hypothetical protein n=1 Tax=Pseudomonas aeruginosa TaxID=287 RepID=UPI0025C91625|nr:hypothetical protein [Pseudomonas aeruginosa]